MDRINTNNVISAGIMASAGAMPKKADNKSKILEEMEKLISDFISLSKSEGLLDSVLKDTQKLIKLRKTREDIWEKIKSEGLSRRDIRRSEYGAYLDGINKKISSLESKIDAGNKASFYDKFFNYLSANGNKSTGANFLKRALEAIPGCYRGYIKQGIARDLNDIILHIVKETLDVNGSQVKELFAGMARGTNRVISERLPREKYDSLCSEALELKPAADGAKGEPKPAKAPKDPSNTRTRYKKLCAACPEMEKTIGLYLYSYINLYIGNAIKISQGADDLKTINQALHSALSESTAEPRIFGNTRNFLREFLALDITGPNGRSVGVEKIFAETISSYLKGNIQKTDIINIILERVYKDNRAWKQIITCSQKYKEYKRPKESYQKKHRRNRQLGEQGGRLQEFKEKTLPRSAGKPGSPVKKAEVPKELPRAKPKTVKIPYVHSIKVPFE